MPVALREDAAAPLPPADEGPSSSCERSSPRDFLTGALDFLGSARLGRLASSAARRDSRSAFLRAASAFFSLSASL